MHSEVVVPPRWLAERWGITRAGSRGPAPRYSVDEVAAAGIARADADGLAGVTLALVASDLGLTTTALYRYVDAKDDLVELMADVALGAPPPLTQANWSERARAWALALARPYRDHLWLASVPVAGQPRRPSLYAWLDALLVALDGAPEGVEPLRLALVLDAVVRGIAPADASPRASATWLTTVVGERHPRLAGAAVRDWGDVGAEVADAVDVVLRGVAAVRPDAVRT